LALVLDGDCEPIERARWFTARITGLGRARLLERLVVERVAECIDDRLLLFGAVDQGLHQFRR
jgi:hypothetical protein